jgi:cysteine desulfurase
MAVYLDNAATTKVLDKAAEVMTGCFLNNYGNPSSLHKKGLEAQIAVDNARKTIASVLVCDPESIYFTSGATESNNLAVMGTAGAYGKRKKKIITTSIEHPSVREAINHLEEQGFEIVRISPRRNGEISCEDVIDAVDENTCLVSTMLVNNETGYILPVRRIFLGVKRKFPDVITHCDAVQGFMKIPVKVKELNADMITLSGHKIHAAKGIGALYVKKGVRLAPITFGGTQEKGYRSGTESVPLISGFGEAVKILSGNVDERYERAYTLRKYLMDRLTAMDGININSNETASPYIINISVEGIRSEIMLHFLEEKEIYVSSGSACSKGAKSSVLREFGLSDKIADTALRISLCAENTTYDMRVLADALKEGQEKIIKIK